MIEPGPSNSLVDVVGVEVGHYSEREALTGVTAVLVREGAVAGVDVRGSAPGSRETDLLVPGNLVERVQAVVLAGGSAFGLAAADGVMRYLEEQGKGQSVGAGRVVPIVPAAVIFDFEVGDWRVRPDSASGYRAAVAASRRPPELGNVGAGCGARAGGLKGGVGSASSVLGEGLTVGALVVVNSLGRAHDPATGKLYGAELRLPGEDDLDAPVAVPRGEVDADYSEIFTSGGPLAGRNTTIGVVATNMRLDKAQATKLAQAAHDGLARAIRPAHTAFDGDAIFALSTGEVELTGPGRLALLGAVAADTFSRAIARAMLSAESAGGLLSYRERYLAGGPR